MVHCMEKWSYCPEIENRTADRDFFLRTSGAVYWPLYQCKIPKFYPTFIKKKYQSEDKFQ